MGSYSYRDQLAARERRAWIQAEEQRIRDVEDREQYEQYVTAVNKENERTPEALKARPLGFEEWRSYMDHTEQDPTLRGVAATSRSLWKKANQVAAEKIARQPLTDSELTAFGFDLTEPESRVDFALLNPAVTANAFKQFLDVESKFDHTSHFFPVMEFLERNRLFPSVDAIGTAFDWLTAMNIIPKPEEPKPNPELNEHGVNLGVEPNPEWETQQRRNEYLTKVVVVDPRDGKEYTEFQLERLPADEWKRLVMGEQHVPNLRNALRRHE